MSASPARSFLKDEQGSVLLEVTASLLTFFLLLFGTVEFSYVFFQWNSAARATEWGARLAAVSSPVASNLATLTGLEPGDNLPGATMPSYDCTCNGATATCTGSVPANATACTYSADAMKTIVYGRGNTGSCVRGTNTGMCLYLPALKPANVVIRYQYTGMGYAGRKSGPVPTITVSLQNVTYQFVFLSGLSRLTSVSFPNTSTSTVTGEDLKATWSSS